MADLKRTALYYPEIAIPPGKWLRQAVLYFDRVASIVPTSITTWTAKQLKIQTTRATDAPKELALISEELHELDREGVYKAFRPESLIERSDRKREDFIDDFMAAMYSAQFQETIGDRRGWCFDAPIHVRKGEPGLFQLLIEAGYAKRDKSDTSWILFERSTAHLYMSLLAKHLARLDRQNTTASTSDECSHFRDISFRVGDVSSGACVAELLFKHAIPCPGESAKIKDILAFKRKRHSELLHFRQEMSRLESTLAAAESVEDVKSALANFADRKNAAIADLNRSFSDTAFQTTLSSLQSLVQIRSPTIWLTGAALAGKLANVSQVPIAGLATGAGVSAAVQVGVIVASGIKKRADETRSNVFSYVFHADRKLGQPTRRSWKPWT